MQRLRKPFDRGDPWSETEMRRLAALEIVGRGAGDSHRATNEDLVQVECFGPEGVEFLVWPKPNGFDERFREVMEIVRLELVSNPGLYLNQFGAVRM